jgi:hypothetical protein
MAHMKATNCRLGVLKPEFLCQFSVGTTIRSAALLWFVSANPWDWQTEAKGEQEGEVTWEHPRPPPPRCTAQACHA